MTTDIAQIERIDPAETESLLADKYVRNTLMGTLADALKKVVGTEESVFYGRPLTESQINNLRTTMQRLDMRISVHRVRRSGVDGHLIRAEYLTQPDASSTQEEADL